MKAIFWGIFAGSLIACLLARTEWLALLHETMRRGAASVASLPDDSLVPAYLPSTVNRCFTRKPYEKPNRLNIRVKRATCQMYCVQAAALPRLPCRTERILRPRMEATQNLPASSASNALS